MALDSREPNLPEALSSAPMLSSEQGGLEMPKVLAGLQGL